MSVFPLIARRLVSVVAPLAFMALPASAQAPASEPAPEDFDEAFESFAAIPPQYGSPPPHAVDIETFEPPREIEEEEEVHIAQSLGSGMASYYGRRFHGRRTANGERFNMRAMTAAHKTLPFGSMVRVTNPRNGRSVVVRINDRGPFVRGRVIDLSRAAAERIGMIRRGHARVEMELLR